MNGHPLIDVHSHALLPAFINARSARKQMDGMNFPDWTAKHHLAMMDRCEVDTSILSIPETSDIAAGMSGHVLARALNEELANIVACYPHRFGAFAVVPMDDMDAAMEEMAYALDVLKLDGVSTNTHYRGAYLGEPQYDLWFAEMDRRGSTLFVHPAGSPEFDATQSRINVSVLDFMFDTTRMVTNMVLSGAKSRFARINTIVTHGGGTIPYLAHRISIAQQMPWAFRDGIKQTVPQALAALGSFYFDLTASTSPAQLDSIRHLNVADRLLLGFDAPFMPEQTVGPAIASLKAYQGFTEVQKSDFAGANALRLFPRFVM